MTELFLAIVNRSIAAGWLLLAVLLARLLLRRAPRWITVCLWGVVVVRLAMPFSLESALSLIPSRETLPPEILVSPTPTVMSGITVIDRAVEPILAGSAPTPGASVNPLQIVFAVLANLWLLGVLLFLLYTALSYLLLRCRVRTAVRLRDNIYESETVQTPFVLGLLRPRIYLPLRMDENTRRYVVAHEAAHIRRLDTVWKLLGFLTLSVFWFHPLLWLGYVLFCRDIEIACDERVIRSLSGAERADYSAALLSCSIRRRIVAACPIAFGEVGVKARVRSVLHYKKPALWIAVAAAVVCAVVAVCFLTDPIAEADPSVTADTEASSDTAAPVTEETTASADTAPITDPPETVPPETAPAEIPVLTPESANTYIAQLLSTLTVHSDNSVSIVIPSPIPLSEDGKTTLTVSMNATYTDGVGSYAVQRLIDNESGWQGGEAPRVPLETELGELLRVSLNVFFYTEVDPGMKTMYARGNTEANAPFPYDTPLGYAAPGVLLERDGAFLRIRYTLTDGAAATLSLTLPEGITAEAGEEMTVALVKDSTQLGFIALNPFGAPDLATWQTVDTAKDELPMPIFAPIALSNHAEYADYTVVSHTDSGAVATARYRWQESVPGAMASAPWHEADSILLYDWSVFPYSAEVRLSDGVCTEDARAALAQSVKIEK